MCSESSIIRDFILSLTKPFNLSDLYYGLKLKHNIVNRVRIRDTLDELCDSGAVDYGEIENDVWAFQVCV